MPYNVILRTDISDIGDKRQLSYAIMQLIKRKEIVRIGYGLYAKTEVFPLTGSVLLKEPNGFAGTIREALDRLNIAWLPSEAEENYNSGKSTQVPVQYILRLNTRFRRKIAYKEMSFKFKQVS